MRPQSVLSITASVVYVYVLWPFNQPVKVLGTELLFFSFDPRGTVSCLLIL